MKTIGRKRLYILYENDLFYSDIIISNRLIVLSFTYSHHVNLYEAYLKQLKPVYI